MALHGTMADKPTIEIIGQYRKYLGDLWSNTHTKWEKIDTYYNRTFQLWPEGMDRPEWFKPMRARSLVDHAVDHQLAHEPLVSRSPAGTGEEHKRNADLLEPGLKAIMDEAALLEPNLTWKQVGKHLLLYGYSVIETGLETEVLKNRRDKPKKARGEDEEEFQQRRRLWEHKKKTMMPFRNRAPHPARVLLDPLRKEPQIAIKHTHRLAQDLHDLTVGRQEQKGKGRPVEVNVYELKENPFEMVLCSEWWTDCWHALATDDGEMLFVEKNTWGFVPYAHAFSGYGQEPTSSSEIDPSYMAVGLIDHALDTLKAQAQAVAGRHNALIEATFNPIITTGEAAELQEQLARGDIIEVNTRGDVGRMEMQQLPRWMFASEEWLDKDLELGTYSRSLAGIREQGVSTVGQQAILSTSASRRFVAPAKQLEHLASVAGSHILQLIDVMDLDLYVKGHDISPKEIEHDYSVRVSFELVDPVLQLQHREMGMREVQAGLKSRETYWSADARLEDATGERRRLLEDFVRSDAMVQKLLAQEVARELGLLEMLERQREQALTEGGGAPPPGSPLEQSILGPDSLPLDQTMGEPGGGLGGGPGGRPPRQPLTPQAPSPSRVGQDFAG